MRIRSPNMVFGKAPFAAGRGASLYGGHGSGSSDDPGEGCVVYRKPRHFGAAWVKGSTCDFGSGLSKTQALATISDPTAAFSVSLPADYASKIAYLQVRIFADGVENEETGGCARLVLDGSLNSVAGAIYGTGVLVGVQQRDGGVVRITFNYVPSGAGLQPTSFQAVRTAGPSSPAAATVTTSLINGVSIDTPALLDSAHYVYKIVAVNGSSTADIITGIIVQADATGPDAPVDGAAEAY